MTDSLRETWNDIAYHWDAWGPPLRPDAEDLRILRATVAGWHQRNPTELAQVFLCGVTPEIATMDWPCRTHVLGIDHSASMVEAVWPGDLLGVRQGMVGDWLQPPVPPHSQDIAIADGGFGFFSFPEGQAALAAALWNTMQPQGLLVLRLYTQAARRESLAEVLEAAAAGRIGNFHIFKWRLAMALQPDSSTGVKQADVWRAWMDAGIDPASHSQPGWSPRAVSTIDFYKDKESCLYFPTLDECRDMLAETFQDIEVVFPGYELGERCPILTARPRSE